MLRTDRLYLRNLTEGDSDTLFGYRNDTRCSLYQRYDDTSLDYLRAFTKQYSNCTFLSTEEEQHYAIISAKTSEMIGDVSLFYTEKDACFTIGITISPNYQRQGYAFELTGSLIGQIRDKYPHCDVCALIDKNNFKSISLFKKLNFTQECYAESIDSFVYVLYGKK